MINSEEKSVYIHEQCTQLQNANIALQLKDHDLSLALQKKESILSALRTENDAFRKEKELRSMEIS